jgi:hypothetical protein
MGLEDHIRKMDEEVAQQATAAARHKLNEDERAVIANEMLRKLGAEAIPILKTRNHGKFLQVSYAAPALSIGSTINPRKVRVVPVQIIWRTTDGSGFTGIDESGALVWCSGGTPPYIPGKRIGGFPPGNLTGISKRALDLAQQMGCDGSVCDPRKIVAYGGPQFDPRDHLGVSAFFLHDSGKLVWGTSKGAMDAEEWMARAIR